jgi:hypothetical protein
MMSSRPARRLAALSPVVVVGLAFAWPIIVVVGVVAYSIAEIWGDIKSERIAALGFGFGHPPFSEAWPGYAILFLPPLVLLSTWMYLRRKERDAQRGAPVE